MAHSKLKHKKVIYRNFPKSKSIFQILLNNCYVLPSYSDWPIKRKIIYTNSLDKWGFYMPGNVWITNSSLCHSPIFLKPHCGTFHPLHIPYSVSEGLGVVRSSGSQPQGQRRDKCSVSSPSMEWIKNDPYEAHWVTSVMWRVQHYIHLPFAFP